MQSFTVSREHVLFVGPRKNVKNEEKFKIEKWVTGHHFNGSIWLLISELLAYY